MTLQDDLIGTISAGEGERKFELNVVVREITDDGDTYYVAECVEIPGCVADGISAEEANTHIQQAIRDCLNVIFQDCVEQLASHRQLPDLTRVVKQERVMVGMLPQLEYA